MLTLLLVCSFSPRVQSIPRGPHIYARNDIKYFVRKIVFSLITLLKSQNFDEIVFFSAGSGKSSVLGVHDFSGSAEKAEYRKIMTFYASMIIGNIIGNCL